MGELMQYRTVALEARGVRMVPPEDARATGDELREILGDGVVG